MFAHPIVAIIFGAFILCAETCQHIGDILAPSAWTDLPLNDWFAGAFLVYGGVALRRDPVRGRAVQAAAWGFMCSLLATAFVAHWAEWRTQSTPSDASIPAGAFMAILSALLLVSGLGLFATLAAAPSADENPPPS
jgi:uncharacterized membrane protein YphA (DoxX/SURF4 family)